MRLFHLHPAHDNAALAMLAMCRYPKDDPLLAIDFVLSDRRAAGLGALDERKRLASRRYSPVRNVKWVDQLTGRIRYSRTINIEPQQVFPDLDFDDYIPGAASAKDMVFTVTTVPARRVAMACQIDRIPDTQDERRALAAMLRELRRSTRAA